MPDLSPAAEAVLDAAVDAYGINYSEFHCCADRVAAAALRAAADQVVPVPLRPDDSCCDMNTAAIRAEILAIANELEAQ